MRALAFLSMLVVSVPALAVDYAPADRVLGGHVFQYPTLQRSAFVETSFGVRQGGAYYTVDPGGLSLLDGRKLELIGATEGADLTLRLADWLGLELGVAGSVVVGNNIRSLFLSGGSFSYAGDAGLVVRVLRLEGTQLSLRAFGGYRAGRDIALLSLVGAVISRPGVTLEDVIGGRLGELLTMPVRSWDVGGGVYAAQALGRLFSLQASVSVRNSWITERPFDPLLDVRVDQNDTALYFLGALAAGLDFAQFHVPVAILGEYLFADGKRSGDTGDDVWLMTHNLGLGLFYSGRQNLQLGLAGSVSINGERVRSFGPNGELERSGEPTLYTGQFIFRYFW